MKTNLLLSATLGLAISVGTLTTANAQATMGDALAGRALITFVGLDFSGAQFAPRYEFPKLDQEGTVMFTRWNNLIQSEYEKFNLAKPLGLGNAPTDVQVVRAVNEKVEVQKAWANGEPTFDAGKVAEMVKKYDTTGKEGVGCVFIVGGFSKSLEQAEFHVTFFDMKTKVVLHTERIVGKPAGFGERNYWAGAVTDVLEDIKKTYKKRWQQKFK